MARQAEVVGLGSCTVDYFAIVPKLIGAEEKVNATRLEIHAGGVTANNLTQLEAMRVARDAGVRVLFDLDVDPAYFVEAGLGTREELLEALRLADVLKPCKAAARELTGETDCEKMARRLLQFGPKLVAITMGGEGCVIASEKGCVHAPAFQVEVVDTGAGDAFMGGLSHALLQGWEYEKVGIFANACAALCCTRVGARAMARLAEVEAFISPYHSQRARSSAH